MGVRLELMKKSILLVLVSSLCACNKVSPPAAAAAPSKCRCDYQAHEQCIDADVEADAGTPGCIIPEEALPHYARTNGLEDPGVSRIFQACNAAAEILPSKCPNKNTEVTIRSTGVVCHWRCGQAKNSYQPQHGPWKLMSAQVEDAKITSR